jgi:hypothetical protein
MLTGKPGWQLAIAEQVQVDGIWAEFGVYKGASLAVWTRLHTPVYGFDTFTGLPEDWREGYPAGHFAVDYLPNIPGAVLVPGLFEDTLPGWLDKTPGPLAFLHVDCDLYAGAAFVLRTLRPRFQPGAVILFDEFAGYPGWEDGEYRAFREELAPFWGHELLGDRVGGTGTISAAFRLL